jgi:hypothetical protein
LSRWKACQQLPARDIDDVDDIVVPAGHIQLGVVRTEMHVARSPRGSEVFDHLASLGVDNEQVIGLFVADENQPGIFGQSRRISGDEKNGHCEWQRQQPGNGHDRFSSGGNDQ